MDKQGTTKGTQLQGVIYLTNEAQLNEQTTRSDVLGKRGTTKGTKLQGVKYWPKEVQLNERNYNE